MLNATKHIFLISSECYASVKFSMIKVKTHIYLDFFKKQKSFKRF